LSWVVATEDVIHPSTNQAWQRVTSLININMLTITLIHVAATNIICDISVILAPS